MVVPPRVASLGPKPTSRALEWVLRIIRWVLYALGLLILGSFWGYVWAYLLIPAAGAAVGCLVALIVAKGKARAMIPAFSVQAGHLVWFMVGLALAGPLQWNLWAHVLILWIGLICLLAVKSWWPAALLMVYQFITFMMTRAQAATMPTPSPAQQAVVAHIVLRLLALILLATGLTHYFSRSGSAVQSGPATMPGPAGATASPTLAVSDPGLGGDVSDQAAEELRRLAALAAEGLITKEEFEAKKKRILGT